METNLESLKIKCMEQCVEFKIKTTQMEYPVNIIVLKQEIPYIISCITGKVSTFNYLDDISHLIQFSPDQWRIIHLLSETYERFYINFPFSKVTSLITYLESIINMGLDFELTEIEIKYFSDMVKPRFSWKYHDLTSTVFYKGKYKDEVVANIMRSLDKWGKKYPELKGCLSRLERIATNYSNGNLVEINISFDASPINDYPDSYYFWIMDGDKRIINGGIIYHKSSNEYCMHT